MTRSLLYIFLTLLIFLAIEQDTVAQEGSAGVQYSGYRRNASGSLFSPAAKTGDVDSNNAFYENEISLELSNNIIVENAPIGSVVGEINQTGFAIGLLSFHVLAEKDDEDRFEFSGNQLVTKTELTYMRSNSYAIDVMGVDGDDNIFYSNFTIVIAAPSED